MLMIVSNDVLEYTDFDECWTHPTRRQLFRFEMLRLGGSRKARYQFSSAKDYHGVCTKH